MQLLKFVGSALLAMTVGMGCGGGSEETVGDPAAQEQTIQSLTVSGVKIAAEIFPVSGQFGLGLVAKDVDDKPILAGGTISAALTGDLAVAADPQYSISLESTETQAPSDNPNYAAILLDDSGSMSNTDAKRLRAEAAKIYWEEILPVRTDNMVALLDFGSGGTSELNFSETRLLQDWTRSTADLEAQMPNIQASGSTPLYESLLETATWLGTSTPAGSNRTILLLSDGQPSGDTQKTAAIEAANSAGIIVHTVGLGPASDLDPSMQPEAVSAVRDVADGTAGVYASATSAETLRPIFQTLAQVAGQGQLVSKFKINPPPPSGTRVTGTVTMKSGGSAVTAMWSFVAP